MHRFYSLFCILLSLPNVRPKCVTEKKYLSISQRTTMIAYGCFLDDSTKFDKYHPEAPSLAAQLASHRHYDLQVRCDSISLPSWHVTVTISRHCEALDTPFHLLLPSIIFGLPLCKRKRETYAVGTAHCLVTFALTCAKLNLMWDLPPCSPPQPDAPEQATATVHERSTNMNIAQPHKMTSTPLAVLPFYTLYPPLDSEPANGLRQRT